MAPDSTRATQNGEMYRAGPPTLGARLLAAASLLRAGHPVADIGCDHGKLSVWLALHGRAPAVIAVDNRPMPLARARALAAQTGCEHLVQCRLGSGLAALQPGEVQDIVIAGLSGETIISILDECAWARAPGLQFVLVPATRHERLRRWLCEAGFAITCEVPVEEKGRYYTVLSVCYTGCPQSPTPFFCQVGLVPRPGSSAAAGYVAARLAHLKKEAKAPMPQPQRAAHRRLIQEVEQCLQSMK